MTSNPITEGKTGTLATYLPGVESYLAEKQAMQKEPAVEVIPEKTVTLTVAKCGEFLVWESSMRISQVWRKQSLSGKVYRRSA